MSPRDRTHPGSSSSPKYPGTFLQAVQEGVATQGYQVRRWLGDGVALVGPEGEERTVYLENLYRRCRAADRAEWPDLIAEFLKHLAMPEEEIVDDINKCPDQLLPRLGKRFKLDAATPVPWALPLGETGLTVNLVIDFPERMAYVNEDTIAKSGKPAEEWLAQSKKRLHERTPPEWCQVIDPDSGVRMATVGDAYDAARTLILDELFPEHVEHGIWAAPLGRDQLLLLPVTPEGLRFVHLLKFLAEKNYPKTPYPISDQVYWIHRGNWYHFPVTLSDNNVSVIPPPQFVETLKLLLPEGVEDESDEPE